jgi:hypothetical protein
LQAELERGEGANSIICYMNENGVSEEVAYKHIQNLLNENWKKMNKDRVINSPSSKYFSDTIINLARISHCTYLNQLINSNNWYPRYILVYVKEIEIKVYVSVRVQNYKSNLKGQRKCTAPTLYVKLCIIH